MILALLLSLASSVLTYISVNHYRLCAVRSSLIVTLALASIHLALFSQNNEIYLLIFGASFIGMSSNNKFNLVDIIMATSVFYVLYNALKNILPSLGGVLGLSAFLSLFIIFTVKLISNFKIPK